jgi:hypothetical protein
VSVLPIVNLKTGSGKSIYDLFRSHGRSETMRNRIFVWGFLEYFKATLGVTLTVYEFTRGTTDVEVMPAKSRANVAGFGEKPIGSLVSVETHKRHFLIGSEGVGLRTIICFGDR